MAGSLNKVILIGNLGADPEIREMPDGTKMAKFSIATTEKYTVLSYLYFSCFYTLFLQTYVLFLYDLFQYFCF